MVVAAGSECQVCSRHVHLHLCSYQERDLKTVKVTLLVISVLMTIFYFLNLLYLWGQNKRKRAIRSTMLHNQEQPGLGDESSWFEYNL